MHFELKCTRIFKKFAFAAATYGTLIGTVVATDVDADTQLEYSLVSPSDLFEIDPFTGKIFLIQNLDYETNKEHIVHIQVVFIIVSVIHQQLLT